MRLLRTAKNTMIVKLSQLTTLIALGPELFSLVSAQTHTECNPMEKTCPANPALSGNYDWNYGGAAPDFKVLPGSAREGKDIIYGGKNGALFRVQPTIDNWKEGSAANPSHPTLVSNFYIMWGKLEITMRAAPGAGVISSVVLQSDDLDEIDWEWVGSRTGEAQSNYFGKGVTAGYTRGATHAVSAMEFHTYGIEWTQQKLDWTIDGKVMRTLMYTDNPLYYPQTPCQVRFGSWSGGDPSNEKGTIEWAGGMTDYAAGPYDMIVKEIKAQDYSTGKQYLYTDKTGSYQSIKSVDGKIGTGPSNKPGNTVGDQGTTSDSPAAAPSGAYQAPTKSNYIISSQSLKSRPKPISEPNTADSPQPTRTPSSPDSSDAHATGSIPVCDDKYPKTTASTRTGSITHPTKNSNIPVLPVSPGTSLYTGAAPTVGHLHIIPIGAVGLVIGWLF